MNTARQLLSLVFEGHDIRTVMQDGKPLFISKDVAAACGLSKYRDAIATHLDPDEVHLVSISTGRQMRAVTCLDEAGVIGLVMASRKPAARRFRRWLLSEVVPQLLKYGTYAPGATAGERCHALRLRWLEERASEKSLHAAAYQESGLLTIAAFRKISGTPVRNVLEFSAVLRSKARVAGYDPARFFTGARRHTPAWPRELLEDAARATTHFLPFT